MEITKKAVDLTDLAIGIVVLGIVVSIGAYMMTTYRDSRLTDLTTITTRNESVTITANQYSATNKWGKAVVSVTNQTTGAVVNTGNYTVSISALDGTLTVTNLTSTMQPWYINYQWYNTTSRPDYELANDSILGLAEYGNWFKIITIVGVAAVVLALIFLAFGRGSMATGGTSGGSY